MWISETDPDYSAQSIGRRLRFYHQDIFIGEYEVGTITEQKNALEYWATLKVAPKRVLKVTEILKGYIGCTASDLSLDEDGKTLLVKGTAADVI